MMRVLILKKYTNLKKLNYRYTKKTVNINSSKHKSI